MKAAWYAKNGPAHDVLETGETDAPSPKDGEVLVRVHASGINPIDTKWRSGLRPVPEGGRVVPHFDGAGVVEKVGAGVSDRRVGERVWMYETLWQRETTGTAGEYATVPSAHAVPLPDNVGFDTGACLGIPAITAHRCVFADGPVTGQTVLVTGGAGAVSGFAIQFLKLGGASVIATVSSGAKADLARAAGADHVVNYRSEDSVERIRDLTGGAGVDRIVEVALGVNFPVSAEVIKGNGVIAAYASDADPQPTLPFRTFLYKNVTLRHVLVFGIPADAKAKAVADIGGWLEAGRLTGAIGARFPLEKIADAHAAVEQGALGNVVLEIGD